MNIGIQIQTLRRQKGITQETLSAEMGVTVGAVSKWENNMTLPEGSPHTVVDHWENDTDLSK